jgi:hypothetical protein
LAAFGLVLDDQSKIDKEAAQSVNVWASHYDTFRLFSALRTQWQVGISGLVGLNYSVIDRVAQWCQVEVDSARFADLRTMESAVLDLQSERCQ